MRKLILLLVLILFSTQSEALKKQAMRLAAEVDQKILTSRDVEAYYIISKLIRGGAPLIPLSYEGDDFRLSLDQLIVESMVFNEAASFGVAKVTDEEIENQFKSVKQKINENPSLKSRWQWLDIADSQLRDKIGLKLRSERLIKYKTESIDTAVTDDEAKEYYEKNRLKFGAVTFENFKPTIKKYIARKNSEDRLREWLDVLKKKHKVKTLL